MSEENRPLSSTEIRRLLAEDRRTQRLSNQDLRVLLEPEITVKPALRELAVRRLWPVVIVGLLLFVSGCARHAPVSSGPKVDWPVTATWAYDFTNFKQCSPTVTVGCISGFSWGYFQGTTKVALRTSPVSVCVGSVCKDTMNTQLGIGPHVFYVVANYIVNNGTPGATAGVNSPTVQIDAGEAANLVVTTTP